MSMVSEALRAEETRAGGARTVSGIVNSIETLEGAGFLVRRLSPRRPCPSSIRSCYLMRWGRCSARLWRHKPRSGTPAHRALTLPGPAGFPSGLVESWAWPTRLDPSSHAHIAAKQIHARPCWPSADERRL